jgi:hypothetical protein
MGKMPSIPLEELLADLGLSDQEDEHDMRKSDIGNHVHVQQ